MALYKAYGNQLVDSRTAMTMVARGQIEGYEREFAPPRTRGAAVTPFVEIGNHGNLELPIDRLNRGIGRRTAFAGIVNMGGSCGLIDLMILPFTDQAL